MCYNLRHEGDIDGYERYYKEPTWKKLDLTYEEIGSCRCGEKYSKEVGIRIYS
jgi:hypothetical protein